MKNLFILAVSLLVSFCLTQQVSAVTLNDSVPPGSSSMSFLLTVQKPNTEDFKKIKLPSGGEIQIPWVNAWKNEQGVEMYEVLASSTKNYQIRFGQPIDRIVPQGTGERQYTLERIPQMSTKAFYKKYRTSQSLTMHLVSKEVILDRGDGMCEAYYIKIRLPQRSWALSTSCLSVYGGNIPSTPYELMKIILSLR